MRTPMRPLPTDVERWIGRARWLRTLDAAVALVVLWGATVAGLGGGPSSESAVLAAALLAAGMAVRPLRVRWRPVSGWVGLRVSRGLRPGDRAWYVRPRGADLVVVTACRGVRITISRLDLASEEGIRVRRTRVLLLAADGP